MDGSLCWSLLNYQIYLLILVGGLWDGWFTLLVTTELPNLPVNTGGEGGCGMDGSLCWSLLNYQIYLLILVGRGVVGWMVHFAGHY